MKILLCSNYLTHHQIPLSDALYELTNHEYCFLAHKEMDLERKSLGWGCDSAHPYACYAGKKVAQKQFNDLDVLIAGSFPEQFIAEYSKKAKLFFRYSERILKSGNSLLKYPKRFIHWHICNPPRRKVYMLCASAFTAGDYAKFGLFHGRCYKWGYFPETRRYPDLNKLFAEKSPVTLLWCGRFLEWKHPDDALRIAQRLKRSGVSFTLKLIGTGPLEEALHQQAEADGFSDCVEFLGTMPPEEVRDVMEQSGIFLFTSDRQEGWGAVVNEAMNSGCAVVASDAAGSVPYLVQPGGNGLVYPSGNVDALYEKAKWLLEHPDQQRKLGEAAYRTITELWNADVAAKRLLMLSQTILDGDVSPDLFDTGPCSRAEIIGEDWYHE